MLQRIEHHKVVIPQQIHGRKVFSEYPTVVILQERQVRYLKVKPKPEAVLDNEGEVSIRVLMTLYQTPRLL